MTMTILLSEEMLGVVDVTSVLLSFLLTTVNWLCSTAELTSNSFVKSLTFVSAAIGIFTHGGMDTSCAECCRKPVVLNISADATLAMQTSIWSMEDDHFLVKVRSHEDELLFLVIVRSI